MRTYSRPALRIGQGGGSAMAARQPMARARPPTRDRKEFASNSPPDEALAVRCSIGLSAPFNRDGLGRYAHLDFATDGQPSPS